MENREITVLGVVASIPQRYEEGQTINAAEAKTLNQTFAENVSNGTRKRVKDMQGEDGSMSDEDVNKAREMIETYAGEYEFTLSSAGASRSVDPLTRECLSIARAAVTAKIKESGRKVKDVDKDALAAKIEEVSQLSAVVSQAKANLKAKDKLNASVMDELGDLPDGEAEPEAA